MLRLALVQLFNTSNKAETERIEKYARPLGAGVIALGVVVLSLGEFRLGVGDEVFLVDYYQPERSYSLFCGPICPCQGNISSCKVQRNIHCSYSDGSRDCRFLNTRDWQTRVLNPHVKSHASCPTFLVGCNT